MPLSDEEVRRIAASIAEQMTENKRALWIDPESHYQQHLFIRTLQEHKDVPELLEFMANHRATLMKKEEDLKSLKNRIIGTVVISFVLGVLGLIGSWTLDVIGKISKLLQ